LTFYLLRTSAKLYRFFTSNIYDYGPYQLRLNDQTWATFKVQACNDAHIGLFDNYMTEEAYEFVLGGFTNTKSSIRRQRLLEDKVSVSNETGVLIPW